VAHKKVAKLRKSAVKLLKSLGRVNLCAARAMLDVGFAVQAVPAIAHRGGRTPSVAQFFRRDPEPLTQTNGQQRRIRIGQSVNDVKVMLAAFRRPRARPGFGQKSSLPKKSRPFLCADPDVGLNA
jgi:hypothetical protein